MLGLIREHGSKPAGRIAAAFRVSRPAISKHLQVLRRAKLLVEDRRGRHRYYHLDPGPLKAVDAWLSDYRVFWNAQLSHLKTFVEQVHGGATAPKTRVRTERTGHK